MDEMSEMSVGGAAAPAAEVHYVGFWLRAFAALIDSIVVLFALVPLGIVLELAGIGIADGDPYAQTIVNLLLALVVLAFWMRRMATPGKMIVNAVIVDAKTFAKPSWQQYVVRYLGYFVSTIPLLLGLVWVAFDRRKQGWHDKLAGTVVIRRPTELPETLP